ncbi:hypothetical protein HGM15179_014754 [Zosterops borbonicus]|uniref:ribonuclease H n=1 Tax=Zosterops borbonicus TaxID=364589 RepID=A0A8K1LFQ5_9PASS|nr:hypothetical protein HGM15179_014754 [Zosterops borbonicus]
MGNGEQDVTLTGRDSPVMTFPLPDKSRDSSLSLEPEENFPDVTQDPPLQDPPPDVSDHLFLPPSELSLTTTELNKPLRLCLVEPLWVRDRDWHTATVLKDSQGTWHEIGTDYVVVGNCKYTTSEIDIAPGKITSDPERFILWLHCTRPPTFLNKGQIIAQVIPAPEPVDLTSEESGPRVHSVRVIGKNRLEEECQLKAAVTEKRPTQKLNWKTNEPVWVEQWPLSKQKLKVLNELVEEQLQKGHIEETTSPWNSPVFVIQKSDKTRWQLLQDLHQINEVIEDVGSLQPGMPSPTMLPQNWNLAVIGIRDCFFQIPLDPDNAPRFAFSVPNINREALRKRYHWKVLLQGMKNSPVICQWYVSSLLSPVHAAAHQAIIHHYTDDVLVCAPNDLLAHALDLTVIALVAAGFKLQESKIQKMPPWRYLGLEIGKRTIVPQKLEIKTKIEILADVHQLCGALNWEICHIFMESSSNGTKGLSPSPGRTEAGEILFLLLIADPTSSHEVPSPSPSNIPHPSGRVDTWSSQVDRPTGASAQGQCVEHPRAGHGATPHLLVPGLAKDPISSCLVEIPFKEAEFPAALLNFHDEYNKQVPGHNSHALEEFCLQRRIKLPVMNPLVLWCDWVSTSLPQGDNELQELELLGSSPALFCIQFVFTPPQSQEKSFSKVLQIKEVYLANTWCDKIAHVKMASTPGSIPLTLPKGTFLICGDCVFTGIPSRLTGGPCTIGKLGLLLPNKTQIMDWIVKNSSQHATVQKRDLASLDPDCNSEIIH